MHDWVRTTLGNAVASGSGKIQTGPFGSQLHASDYVDLGIPCIMPTNMRENRVDLTDIAFISAKDAKRLSQHLVKEGDIVYSRRGDVTQKALIRAGEAGYFCGTGCLLVRPGTAIDPEFLTYHLSTPSNQAWIVHQAVGAHMANLNTGILSEVPLRVPCMAEQKRLASVLSAFDAKIDLNNRINAELEALAKTIYDYWFVQFDFPDANGRPYKSSGGAMVWNDTLTREIPAGWGVRSVGDLLLKQPNSHKVPSGAVQKNGHIPVIDQSTDFICGYTDDVDAKIEIDTPHIVFGDHTRIVKLVCFSYARGADGTQVLIPNSKLIAPFTFFQSIFRIDLSNYGYARHFKFLKGSPIVTPDNRVGVQYDATVKPFFVVIESNRQQNHELTQLRDWLLPLLMNGQVRVA